MVAKKSKRGKTPTLIIEPHPKDYNGVSWATYIQYSGYEKLVVVNSLEFDYLWAYSIESMNEEECEIFYQIMEEYWIQELYGEPLRYKISPDQWISERSLGFIFGKLITAYNVENISRIIGPVREPDIVPPKTAVRRRKRIEINRDLIKR